MKKSIAILSIFLLTIFSSFHNEVKACNVANTEIGVTSGAVENGAFSSSTGISSNDDENDPDPPRQDPWQWISILDALFSLLSSRIL